MLNRPVTYKGLMYLAGLVFLFLALAHAYQIATTPVFTTYSNSNETVKQLQIELGLGALGQDIILGGTLPYVAIGILLLGIGSQRARWMFWSLQAGVWLIGITLWYQANGTFDPFPVQFWPWMGATLICSFALLALYWPIVWLLRRLLERPQTTT
jgi:hypothetical protein